MNSTGEENICAMQYSVGSQSFVMQLFLFLEILIQIEINALSNMKKE